MALPILNKIRLHPPIPELIWQKTLILTHKFGFIITKRSRTPTIQHIYIMNTWWWNLLTAVARGKRSVDGCYGNQTNREIVWKTHIFIIVMGIGHIIWSIILQICYRNMVLSIMSLPKKNFIIIISQSYIKFEKLFIRNQSTTTCDPEKYHAKMTFGHVKYESSLFQYWHYCYMQAYI